MFCRKCVFCYCVECSLNVQLYFMTLRALLFLLLFMTLLSLFPSWFSACFCQFGLQHYTPNVPFCEFYIHSLGIPTELPFSSKLMSYDSLCLFCLIILQCSVSWTQSPVHMRKVFYHWAYTPKFLQIFYSLWLTIFLWCFFLLLNMSPKCFYVFCSVVQGEVFCKCWVILDYPLPWIIQMNKAFKR